MMTPLRAALVAAANAIADAVESRQPAAVETKAPERVLKYREVAVRLGCHIDTARARGKAGLWPEVRIDGSVGVRERDLEAYIRGRSAQGQRRQPLVMRSGPAA